MKEVSIRRLANDASAVLNELRDAPDEQIIITNRGRPVAALIPLTVEQLEDWVLTTLIERNEQR